MTIDPVRTGRLQPSLDAEPRSASRLRLDIAVKMLRLRFYNRRFASRAPAKTSSLETTAAFRRVIGITRENPPLLGIRIAALARRFRRSFERDAGPPRRFQRGHPASGGHVLDGTKTGFGPTGAHGALLRGVKEIAAALSAKRAFSPVRAL
jgi:hypothetical protein